MAKDAALTALYAVIHQQEKSLKRSLLLTVLFGFIAIVIATWEYNADLLNVKTLWMVWGAVVLLLVVLSIYAVVVFYRNKKILAEADDERERYKSEYQERLLRAVEAQVADKSQDWMRPPRQGEEPPVYVRPANPELDPYSAKPKGYAAEQAKLGHPRSQGLPTLTHPEGPVCPSELREEFDEYRRKMADIGVTGSDLAMYEKFKEYRCRNVKRW